MDINILDRVLDEISEMKEYKKLYESQKKDKERMSKIIFDFMMIEYNNSPYEQRVKTLERDTCGCCRYEDVCDIKIQEDILKPIESDNGWIPSNIGCSEFDEWN